MKLEEAVELAGERISPATIVTLLLLVTCRLTGCFATLFTNFGGYIPYTDWICNATSEVCQQRTNSGVQIERDTLCGVGNETQLILHTDFNWDLKGRMTYATDWDLYCDREYIGTFISSLYFVGGFLGLFVGGNLFDTIGRKRSVVFGLALCAVSVFAMPLSPSPWFLIGSRIAQGCGYYITAAGTFIFLLEYTPVRYRVIYTGVAMSTWAVGYLLLSLLAYLIYSWKMIAVVGGCIFTVNMVLYIVLIPESPKYLLINKGDEAAAKRSLQWFAEKNGVTFDFDSVTLETPETADPGTKKSFMESLKDFLQYKEMSIQTGLQMCVWLIIGFLYYGFNFSWSKLGKNLYISYTLAGLGELIAYTTMIPILQKLGRKSMMWLLFIAAAMFLFAMVPESVGWSAISVSQIACLIGNMVITAVFGAYYLYTSELAPTSHRGKILSVCSMSARVGAFCGPQASLLFEWNTQATLVFFAVLAAAAGIINWQLPETQGRMTPNTATEVKSKREIRNLEALRKNEKN